MFTPLTVQKKGDHARIKDAMFLMNMSSLFGHDSGPSFVAP